MQNKPYFFLTNTWEKSPHFPFFAVEDVPIEFVFQVGERCHLHAKDGEGFDLE